MEKRSSNDIKSRIENEKESERKRERDAYLEEVSSTYNKRVTKGEMGDKWNEDKISRT